MKKDTQHEVGQSVEFIGYTGNELPDNHDLLVIGDIYQILEATPSDSKNEEFYTLGAPNPEYNDTKRKTINNQPVIGVEVYTDEFDTVLDDETQVDEAEEEIEEDVEEDVEEEEVVKKTPVKKTPVKKTPVKKTTAKKTPVKKTTAKKTTAKKTPVKKTTAKKATVKKTTAKKTKSSGEVEETTKDSKSQLKEVADTVDTDMIVLSESEEDAQVLELVEGTDDICALAEEMRQDSANLDYLLGGVLYHIRLSKAYKGLDERYAANKGFALFVDERLGIRYRSAMNLISVYTTFSKCGVDKSVYTRLGRTKCVEVARVATEDNVDELITLAEESTVMEIKDSIKEYDVTESDSIKKVKRIVFKFSLHEDQATTVRTLFEEAKESLGLDSDEDVFESIVTEWAMDHLNVKSGKKARTTAKTKPKRKAVVEEVA